MQVYSNFVLDFPYSAVFGLVVTPVFRVCDPSLWTSIFVEMDWNRNQKPTKHLQNEITHVLLLVSGEAVFHMAHRQMKQLWVQIACNFCFDLLKTKSQIYTEKTTKYHLV